MAGNFSVLFSLLLLVSCQSTPVSKTSQAEQEEIAPSVFTGRNITAIQKLDLPPAATTWDADLYLVNFNTHEEEKVKKAVSIIKKVISSMEFKDRVLNYSHNGTKQFNDNDGLTNEDIYLKILEGAEKIGSPSKNNTMDVELELYHQTTKTIGYTYPNTVRIWMNKKYFDRYTPIEVADNLMHEWMHKLGFTHATTWSKNRDHTVPYAIGYLVEELAKKYPEP
ncbi:MAG: hypothetical protein NDI69_15010 [Bacteriovoracaceae bacterium]|nr:hypothetical protein [Bacteriovoracaceae bacterium]